MQWMYVYLATYNSIWHMHIYYIDISSVADCKEELGQKLIGRRAPPSTRSHKIDALSLVWVLVLLTVSIRRQVDTTAIQTWPVWRAQRLLDVSI